jgi:hypothetical protein
MCRLEGGVDNVKDPDVTSGDTGGGFQGGQWIHSHGPIMPTSRIGAAIHRGTR